jgi:hypothetical protein
VTLIAQVRLAAVARSILACPAEVSLVVDGDSSPLGDDAELRDRRGTPVLVCRPGSPVHRAAVGGRNAMLSVGSGLGPIGGPERDDTLALAGRLTEVGVEECECCQEVRHLVALDLDAVVLVRDDRGRRVPLDQFRHRAHELNRGHLQRSVEHANDCHQEELRQAVGHGTGTRAADVVGVRIARLSPADVVVQWVDSTGAHEQVIAFAHTARDLDDLGDLLRRGLHAGLC